jgi:hypothetical protein
MPLVTSTESEPTHGAPSPGEPAPVAPVLGANDSEPIMSVTLMPDSAPVVAPTTLRPVDSRRRGLALIGVGMGLGIVLLVFGGVKLLSGPKRTAPAVPAQAAAPAVEPVVEAVPTPLAAEQQAAAEKRAAEQAAAERRAAKQQAAAERRAAKQQAAAERRAAKQQAIAEKRAAKEKAAAEKLAAKEKDAAEKRAAKEQAIAEKHARQATHRAAKAHTRRSARAQKVAMQAPAAKRSPPPPSPERADPRPAYERGNALLLAGDGKAAIAAYREAVKSNPSDPIGFRGLGLAYEQQGETASAVRALKRYLKLAPHAADEELIAKRIDRLAARAKQK